jgi:hypothetical protein
MFLEPVIIIKIGKKKLVIGRLIKMHTVEPKMKLKVFLPIRGYFLTLGTSRGGIKAIPIH